MIVSTATADIPLRLADMRLCCMPAGRLARRCELASGSATVASSSRAFPGFPQGDEGPRPQTRAKIGRIRKLECGCYEGLERISTQYLTPVALSHFCSRMNDRLEFLQTLWLSEHNQGISRCQFDLRAWIELQMPGMPLNADHD